METKDILLIVAPLLTAIISALVTYILTKRAKKDDAIFKYKEEKYANLIYLLQGFLHKGNKNSPETQHQYFEEQYKSWLYSSDEVVLAMNEFNSKLKQDGLIHPDIMGNIILAMRKDMLGKTDLKPSDFKYTVRNKSSISPS